MNQWQKALKLIDSALVTCLGLGFFPRGSGTVASFFALGFWSLFLIFDLRWLMILLSLLMAVGGVWLIRVYERRTRTEDSSVIVIDEWVGMGMSLWPCALRWTDLLLAFVLFRLFDIWKPPGVRYFDRNHLKSWGVMLDDVVAGLYAAICIGVIKWIL